MYILIVIAFYAIVLVVLMFKYISAEWKKDHRVRIWAGKVRGEG